MAVKLINFYPSFDGNNLWKKPYGQAPWGLKVVLTIIQVRTKKQTTRE